jgi:hypothetical protein
VKKSIGVLLIMLVFVTVFCSLTLNTVSADENYEDYSKEYGDENNPWDLEEGIVPNNNYRDEDRTRNKDN